MQDTIGNLVGYPILGVALVLLWRLYVEIRKDRDFWRAEALDRKDAMDDALDDSETLLRPLKKVEKAVKARTKPPTQVTDTELLRDVIEVLLPRKGEG